MSCKDNLEHHRDYQKCKSRLITCCGKDDACADYLVMMTKERTKERTAKIICCASRQSHTNFKLKKPESNLAAFTPVEPTESDISTLYGYYIKGYIHLGY